MKKFIVTIFIILIYFSLGYTDEVKNFRQLEKGDKIISCEMLPVCLTYGDAIILYDSLKTKDYDEVFEKLAKEGRCGLCKNGLIFYTEYILDNGIFIIIRLKDTPYLVYTIGPYIDICNRGRKLETSNE